MILLRWLYAFTIFLSAFLLFVVEPMAAKQLLPVLGGSAAVWTTCLVFFQIVLLLGYLYAHWVSSKLKPLRQAQVHIALLLAALLVLGIQIRPRTTTVSYHPAATVFWLLSAIIGIPYLVLSATTPLMTAWHARSFAGESSYRLFALSSFASLLALASYPAFIEPHWTLPQQTALWTHAFLLFAVLCGAIAWVLRTQPLPGTANTDSPAPAPDAGSAGRLFSEGRWGEKAMWFFLALGGGSMLEAVTSHMSQNIAAIPLLWLPPLALYLASFVLTFQGSGWYRRPMMLRLALLALAAMIYALLNVRQTLTLEASIPLFLTGLFLVCFFLNGELYARRPAASGLTQFYLLIAAGGASGTMLIGILAPLIFSANYDLASTLIVVTAIALAAVWQDGWGARAIWTAGMAGAILATHAQISAYREDAVALTRDFYATLRVKESYLPPQSGTDRQLFSGTTEHGAEWFAPEFRDQPLTYYGEDSGVGLAMRLCCGQRPKRVGVIGLGTGTVAAYGNQGDLIRFYEIDPMVERLARSWFTFLRDSKARTEVVLGDARQSLAAEPPQHFDVLVVDAFSGDAIPVHLLTSQALALYRKHLQPGGILAFHVSNRYLDLKPVVAAIAADQGLEAVSVDRDADEQNGLYSSDWVLVTANRAFLSSEELASAVPLVRRSGIRTWTDSYSSVWPLIKWRGY